MVFAFMLFAPILSFMGFSLHVLLCFVLVVETCATRDSILSSSAPTSKFVSAFHILATSR
jgi:hypothetical protein